MSPCGSAGGRHVSLMKRVETSEATTSRGAEGVGPPPGPAKPGVTRSAVALVSEVEGGVGRATSWGTRGEGRSGRGGAKRRGKTEKKKT